MTRLIDADELKKMFEETICIEPVPYAFIKQIIDNAPTIDQPLCEWITIKTRPLTEEEKEAFPDCSYMYDCQMPEDGQEVIVTTRWGVRFDIYCKDVDGSYFESYCDDGEVLAWMPFPRPYERGENDEELSH